MPSPSGDIRPCSRDTFAQLAGLFLHHAGEDAEYEFVLQAAVDDAVDVNIERLALFPGADTLGDAPPAAMQPCHDTDAWRAGGREPARLVKHGAVLRTVVTFAADDVREFSADHPAVRGGIRTAMRELCGKA